MRALPLSIITGICLLVFVGFSSFRMSEAAAASSNAPQYTADGKMVFPANYREWVFLSSGLGMNYGSGGPDLSTFDNVFVNPEAYREFLKTGTWPDKTMFVLELRSAGTNASINKSGHFQTKSVGAREVHVKDERRFPGKWAFFGFNDTSPGDIFPQGANCYSCHQDHAAVDTTFVQFYPTLIDIAKEKKTLSAAYLKDEATAKKN
jgi:hypothetical protein